MEHSITIESSVECVCWLDSSSYGDHSMLWESKDNHSYIIEKPRSTTGLFLFLTFDFKYLKCGDNDKIYSLSIMRETPGSFIENIGKNIFFTTMLFAVLQLNASFSDAKYLPDGNKESIENNLDLKAIYKANISKSILDAKAFPIQITYLHEKELKAWWFTLWRTISFVEKIPGQNRQGFVLIDDTGKKKYLAFSIKVPFDYNNDEVKKLYIKSFWFNPKENKFTMQGIYTWESKNPLKEVIGKIIVWSAVERTINLQKIVMLNTIVPSTQWEKMYEVKIPINNPAGDIVEATIVEVLPKKVKGTGK